jgi:hypothetical protein
VTPLEAFRVVAPEFASTPDATVTGAIGIVASELSESKFGSDYAKAHAYLAAHFLAWQAIMAAGGSTSGAATAGRITGEREGDLSRQYADNSRSPTAGGSFADNLDRTAYGLEYKRLARRHVVGIVTRMG